jgi:hypothetical protein
MIAEMLFNFERLKLYYREHIGVYDQAVLDLYNNKWLRDLPDF